MNIAIAIQVISGLLSVSVNAMQAMQAYVDLVNKARTEGRDITDEELAALRAGNQALVDEILRD